MSSTTSAAVIHGPPVDPSTITFSKTRFPENGEVKQFPATDKGRVGQWFIVLNVRPRVNGRFERKNRIGKSNGDGYYATEAAAARDIHNHRMLFEGFVKRGGLWYDADRRRRRRRHGHEHRP
jgi:hypothetical protein